MSNRDGEIPIV